MKEVIRKNKGYDSNQIEQGEELALYKRKKIFLRPKVGNCRKSHQYLPDGLFVSFMVSIKVVKSFRIKDFL